MVDTNTNYPQLDVKNGIFNQAQFQQIRMHEILIRCDRLYTSPLDFNEEFNTYNYIVIINDYTSLFLNIISKLTQPERKGLDTIKKELTTLTRHRPPFIKKIKQGSSKPVTQLVSSNWDLISERLFKFRELLEDGMEAHGLGNPNKQVGGAAILEI